MTPVPNQQYVVGWLFNYSVKIRAYNTYACYRLVYRASHGTDDCFAHVILVGTPFLFKPILDAFESMSFNHELKLQVVSYVPLK